MKKFGTPTWAAPGWARENVGVRGGGVPSVFVLGLAVLVFGFGFGLGCVAVLQRGVAGGARLAGWPTAFSCAERIATPLRAVLVVQRVRGLPGFVDLGLGWAGGAGAGTVIVMPGSVGAAPVVGVVVPSVLAGVVGAGAGRGGDGAGEAPARPRAPDSPHT